MIATDLKQALDVLQYKYSTITRVVLRQQLGEREKREQSKTEECRIYLSVSPGLKRRGGGGGGGD